MLLQRMTWRTVTARRMLFIAQTHCLALQACWNEMCRSDRCSLERAEQRARCTVSGVLPGLLPARDMKAVRIHHCRAARTFGVRYRPKYALSMVRNLDHCRECDLASDVGSFRPCHHLLQHSFGCHKGGLNRCGNVSRVLRQKPFEDKASNGNACSEDEEIRS